MKGSKAVEAKTGCGYYLKNRMFAERSEVAEKAIAICFISKYF